jgi:dTDP-4-amino-4,6-dideoxygalactose transaminase/dTDP-4-dehydrorhamnose 3,5-epimerase-like enzyme
VTLEDDVFVGPNATFCNDKFPRSKVHLETLTETVVEHGASLGANCTILPGIRIGAWSMVGAGSVVTHNVSPKTVVAGNPARHLRFVDAAIASTGSSVEHLKSLAVKGASFLNIPTFCDRRGVLSFAEYETHLSWAPVRFFTVTGVPINELRGYHAHKSVKQFLVCLAGRISVLVDDGITRETVLLDSPRVGLLLEPMVWSSQSYLEANSILLVMCSEKHSHMGYIHNYSEFLSLVQQQHEPKKTVKVPFLNVRAATAMVESDLRSAFERVLSSGIFVGGDEVEKFEGEWADYCGATYCVGVASGLAALHLILLASNIGEGDEVIVPANTYIATLLAVSMTGAKCILVEPCRDTRLLDVSRLDAVFTTRTRAVLSCDLYGAPVDYHRVSEWAKGRGILFFSDAAQSHGAKFNNSTVGSDALCDGSCFSFYPSKNLGALGEAGAITTGNKALADRVRLLRNYGSRVRYRNEEKGFNERLDPLQASFLRAKLKHLSTLNGRRTAIATKYLRAFDKIPRLSVPVFLENVSSNFHLFVVGCDKRDELQAFLKARDIDTVIHYPIPPHLSEAYKDLGFREGDFPITEELANRSLSLPVCPFMLEEQIQAVITAVCSFFKE